MWGFWVLLCAAFLTESFADVSVVFGQQLTINLTAVADRLQFKSTDESMDYTIWSNRNGARKGTIMQLSTGKRFIINSASFDDEGVYTEQSDHWTSETKVKVLSSAETKSCEVGETLTISLGGLTDEGASLHFSKGAEDIMLVHQGLLVREVPTFRDRIKVTRSSIQVLDVRGSDAGRYTLMDRKGRVAKISTLHVTSVCADQVDVQYGRQLSIKLPSKATSMGMKPLNQFQEYIVWSGSVQPSRGKLRGSGQDKRFIISSANFEDQGVYTLRNTNNKVICVTNVQVKPSTETKRVEVGGTLTISLDVIKKNEASLNFDNGKMVVLLVKQGSPMQSLGNFSQQIKVTNSSIQILNIQVADEGKYKLLDSEDRVVKITTLNVTDPCADKVDVNYGQKISIKLLVQFNSLGFTSLNKMQNNIIGPQSAQTSRGNLESDKRHFTINSVNFEDQGNYTQWNKQNNTICITKVTVSPFKKTEKCEAGKTFTISLDGIKENEASLHFSNKEHVNLMLVRRGVPQRNNSDFYNRTTVNSSSIQVLKISASDVGEYTLFDGEYRKAKIITIELTEPINWMAICASVIMVVILGLLACCIYRRCYRSQPEATFSNSGL